VVERAGPGRFLHSHIADGPAIIALGERRAGADALDRRGDFGVEPACRGYPGDDPTVQRFVRVKPPAFQHHFERRRAANGVDQSVGQGGVEKDSHILDR